jgi:hypothetical protein
MRVEANYAQGGTEASRCAPLQPTSRDPTAPRHNSRAHRVAASLVLVVVFSRLALPASTATKPIILQRPLAIGVDCVKSTLKKNGYALLPDNAAQAGTGPVAMKRQASVVGVRRLNANEVKRFAALGILKNGEPHIDYGLARMNISLIPIDAGRTQVSLASSIIVFMVPGIPLMVSSRLFPLGSNGALEANLLASLKQSTCAGWSAPSPTSH